MMNKTTTFFPVCEQISKLNLRLHQLAENNRCLMMEQKLRLPAMMVIAEEGADLDTNVMSVIHQLKQDQLIRFACSEPIVEYEPKHNEADINRLLDQMEQYAGYHNSYTGVVVVWLNKELRADYDVFHYLTRLVADQQGKAMFIFAAPSGIQARQLNDMMRQLSTVVPLEVIHISAVAPDCIAKYFEQLLYDQGFSLSRDARKALPDCISQWMQDNKACVTIPGMVAMRDKVVFNAAVSRPMGKKQIQLADLRMPSYPHMPAGKRENRTIGF